MKTIKTIGLAAISIFAGLAMAAMSPPASAASFPNGPMRIIIPFGAGGTSDILARTIGDAISHKLGVPVTYENRRGAHSTIALRALNEAPPDGQTIGLIATSYTVNPCMYPKTTSYKFSDFTPLARVTAVPNVCVVTKANKVKSFKDMLADIKKHPGKYNYASTGKGTPAHLGVELLKGIDKLDFKLVMYKDTPSAFIDILGGRVDFMCATYPTARAQIEGGTLRPLAVTSPERVDTLPNVPTIAELGYKDFEATVWYGFLGPKGMAPDIQKKLQDVLLAVLSDKTTSAKLKKSGYTIYPMPAAQFSKFIEASNKKWCGIVKDAGLANN
jgi:tripartite-type tricarboxylate transporter receptor subunit TctC